jgi:hypothetical protein
VWYLLLPTPAVPLQAFHQLKELKFFFMIAVKINELIVVNGYIVRSGVS